jgi:hypothetical protein
MNRQFVTCKIAKIAIYQSGDLNRSENVVCETPGN